MTLKQIYEYLEPLLHDEGFANQRATLIVHCSNGDIKVRPAMGDEDTVAQPAEPRRGKSEPRQLKREP